MINFKYIISFFIIGTLSVRGYCQKADLYVDLVNPSNRTLRSTSASVKGYAESGGIAWLHFGIYSDYFFEGKLPISFEWIGRKDNNVIPTRIIKRRELKQIELVSTDYLLRLLEKVGYNYNKSYRLFFVEPYKGKKYKIINVTFSGDLSNNDVLTH